MVRSGTTESGPVRAFHSSKASRLPGSATNSVRIVRTKVEAADVEESYAGIFCSTDFQSSEDNRDLESPGGADKFTFVIDKKVNLRTSSHSFKVLVFWQVGKARTSGDLH